MSIRNVCSKKRYAETRSEGERGNKRKVGRRIIRNGMNRWWEYVGKLPAHYTYDASTSLPLITIAVAACALAINVSMTMEHTL